MKLTKIILPLFFSVSMLAANAGDIAGKAIYLPEELKDNDFNNPNSQWSLSRMAMTENAVLFWAPGFGSDITNAPDLDGHNMKVNLANLLAKIEEFYRFYYNDLGWVKPGQTKADKYRMMVMLNYSLEGTAYGGAYDDAIGALWIAPNRVQDSALNCIAHELGHSFQAQISCDGQGDCWGGCGMFEMCAQWMLWQVNPDWQRDENYHLKAFQDLTHKAFLHIDNIYHSPYVLEYWADKHGREIIAELFRQGREGEDPVMTYKRQTGISQEEFNDEMFEASCRMINWDYDRVWENTRPYACNGWHTQMVQNGSRYMPAVDNCPENYGFNAIELKVPEAGATVEIDFKGEAGKKGYFGLNTNKAGWRYGLVMVDKSGKSSFTEMQKAPKGKIKYSVPADAQHLYLVVMGAPSEHWPNIDGEENPGDAQWPYSITVKGTDIM